MRFNAIRKWVMSSKSFEWIFYPLVFKSCRTPFAWVSPRTYVVFGAKKVGVRVHAVSGGSSLCGSDAKIV